MHIRSHITCACMQAGRHSCINKQSHRYTALEKIRRPLQNSVSLVLLFIGMCLGKMKMLSFHVDVGWLYATPGAKIQAVRLCLMACDQPSSSWSHSSGFQWGSGLEIGLAMIGSWSGGPPSTPWLTWLCGLDHCPAESIFLLGKPMLIEMHSRWLPHEAGW